MSDLKCSLAKDSFILSRNRENVSDFNDVIVKKTNKEDEGYYYLCMVKEDGTKLDDVPLHYRSKEICTVAVKQNGKALQFVPGCLIDMEICTVAVKQNGKALQFVPGHLKTKELCSKELCSTYDLYDYFGLSA